MTDDDFRRLRHELHRFPELSGDEKHTKQRIKESLTRFAPDEVTEVGKTGLVVTYDSGRPGRSILVRAELDALPIQEVNTFPYRSGTDGVSHKCGHDGHMAILCRLASLLHQENPRSGKVYLLFQPAEENGMGAQEVYDDPVFRALPIDRVVALHNLPGHPLHTVVLRTGAFTPAVTSIIVAFKGKTSHAAEPELGLNPAAAMAGFMQDALARSKTQIDQADFFLVTPVYMTMGTRSYGVSAGYGEVHLTIRAWHNEVLDRHAAALKEMAEATGKSYGLQTDIQWTQTFQANYNDPQTVDLIRAAAEREGLAVTDHPVPMKWGEDFGLFTNKYRGAMFGLGAGEGHAALHNPDYDFPDELIVSGSDLFYRIVNDFLDGE